MQIEPVGVYAVDDAAEPCHIVELIIHGTGSIDLASLTQEEPGQPRSNWQVPYDEHLFDAVGENGTPVAPGHLILSGVTRIAFFFHYLASERPLLTPAGPVRLPAATPRPMRLAFMRYAPP